MANNRDELNKRRKSREARRRKQQEQQRKLYIRIVIAAVILVAAAAGLMLLTRKPAENPDAAGTGSTVQATQPPVSGEAVSTEEPTVPSTEANRVDDNRDKEPTTVIHLAAAGDLVVSDSTVEAGMTADGYDYTEIFMDVAPAFAEADLALLNFEGNLVGAPYGTDTVSAPQAMAEAISAMGVDLVQMANSYSVTHGINGLADTLENIRAAGLEPLGAFASAEEFQKAKGYTVVEVQGIRVALVAFTKGVGGLSLPAGSEDCVNLLYTDYATTYQDIDKEGITSILTAVETEAPDITIALVHWGSEYKDLVTGGQEDIAELMQNHGVDVILGTHSHMIHQIDYDPLTGKLVAYSLGDFYGEADRAGTDYSIILDLEITRDNTSGETRVTGYSYTPIYTLTENTAPDGQRRVVRLKQMLDAYEEDFVEKVSESVYEDMTYALERIVDRVTPDEATEEE